jgi:hypothetical protein
LVRHLGKAGRISDELHTSCERDCGRQHEPATALSRGNADTATALGIRSIGSLLKRRGVIVLTITKCPKGSDTVTLERWLHPRIVHRHAGRRWAVPVHLIVRPGGGERWRRWHGYGCSGNQAGKEGHRQVDN